MILYLHGFNSGTGDKVKILETSFPSQKVKGYNFLNKPWEDFNNLVNIVKESTDDLYIIGTSLGGFYGLILHNFLERYISTPKYSKLFLLNPSLNPSLTLSHKIGEKLKNYKTQEVFILSKEFISDLEKLESKYISESYQWLNTANIYLSKEDEVLDHSKLINYLKESHLPYNNKFSNQNHRHSDISEVIEDLEEYVNSNI